MSACRGECWRSKPVLHKIPEKLRNWRQRLPQRKVWSMALLFHWGGQSCGATCGAKAKRQASAAHGEGQRIGSQNRQRLRKLKWCHAALQKEAGKHQHPVPRSSLTPVASGSIWSLRGRCDGTHSSWWCMEGPCHLLWGLRDSRLGACLNWGPLTLARKQNPEDRLSLKQGRVMSPAQTVRTLNSQ